MKELLGFARKVKTLQRITENDPLSWWRPTYSQKAFLEDNSRLRLLLGGNQVGKTSAACALLIYHCLGRHPYYQVDPPPIEAWIITHSIEQSRTIQAKLWEMIPKDQLHPDVEFIRGKGFRGVTPLVKWKNGSIIRIKTANQGLGLASASCALVVLDEPVPAEVWNECLARTLRGGRGNKAGMMAMTMTPVGNVDVRYIQEMVESNKISTHRAPLTVKATTPVGLAPLLTQKQIDDITAGWLPVDRQQRINGDFNTAPAGVIFDQFDPSTMIINRPCPPAMYKYAVGIDHGTTPGSQCAVIAAINMEDVQNPEVYILDEYSSGGSATPEDHATGILEMVTRNGIRPEQCRWTGDGDHYGSRGNKGVSHMSNLVLMRAMERVQGLRHRTLQFTIRKAIKKRHSVYFSASVLYAIMSRKKFFVSSRCQTMIQSIQTWTMKRESSARSRDPAGHIIDALRYCVMGTLDYKQSRPSHVRIV